MAEGRFVGTRDHDYFESDLVSYPRPAGIFNGDSVVDEHFVPTFEDVLFRLLFHWRRGVSCFSHQLLDGGGPEETRSDQLDRTATSNDLYTHQPVTVQNAPLHAAADTGLKARRFFGKLKNTNEEHFETQEKWRRGLS